MNRKGFTLIEVLAVIIILGIILVVAVPNLLNAYEASKLKSEEIFTGRLSGIIDSYIKLNSDEIGFTSDGTATKEEEGEAYTVNISKGTINIQDIINDELISQEDYKNPGNTEVSCSTSAEIEVYRDSDFVYCHKVKKDSLGCLTDNYKNSITGDYVIDTCIWEEAS